MSSSLPRATGRTMRRSALGFFASALSACTVGPDYQRPELDAPTSFRDADDAEGGSPAEPGADTVAFGNQPWFEVFDDPVLQDLIHTAIGENLDLRIALERILASREVVTIAGADAYPQVRAGASGDILSPSTNGLNDPGAGADDPLTQATVGADLSWTFDLWGKVRRASEAARAQLIANEAARLEVLRQLVTDLAAAYFELRELDLEHEITLLSLASRRASLELVQARLDGGVANKVEVYQAQVLVTTAEQLLPDLERRQQQKENQIRILLGGWPGPVPRGSSLAEQRREIEIPAGLPSELLARRPDLVFAEQRLIEANARIGEAKALLYPSVSLTAAGGLQSEDLNDLTQGGSLFWGLLPTIQMPIFQAGRLRANVALTEAQQRAVALGYAAAVRQAFREVSDALIGVAKQRAFREQSAALAETLTSQRELSDERYRGASRATSRCSTPSGSSSTRSWASRKRCSSSCSPTSSSTARSAAAGRASSCRARRRRSKRTRPKLRLAERLSRNRATSLSDACWLQRLTALQAVCWRSA
ncbi:MAG: efflux transporter outer membrane subunit [Planctomycetes bacterium]|nr:efflux transporter outer membrane subunit [Planctomycetota bacterium]